MGKVVLTRHLCADDQSRVPVGPRVVDLSAGSADAAVRLEHVLSDPTAQAARRLRLPHQAEGPGAAVEEVPFARVADGPVGIRLIQQPLGRSRTDLPIERQAFSPFRRRQLASGGLHSVGDSTSRSGRLPGPLEPRAAATGKQSNSASWPGSSLYRERGVRRDS